jgi:transcriptional regulator with XRE-family HTH domain
MTTAIPSIPRTVGGRLHYFRETAGLKREQAAIHVGRSAVTVRDWELDQRVPRYVLLVQLARLYGVSVTELIGANSVAPR